MLETIEKMKKHGAIALSNSELMSLVLCDETVSLAEQVFDLYGGNLNGLYRATAEELQTIKGIGEKKAQSIMATVELAKRMRAEPRADRKTVRDCSDVYDLVYGDYAGEKREILIALLLNVKGEIESKEIISIGELAATNIHPREVLSPAIRKGAAAIVITHNHPSGDPSPSEDDILATRRLQEACKIVGIKLLDHVICGDCGRYTSLKCEGIIA